MTVWIGIDQGADNRAHAEHMLESLLGALWPTAELACTHAETSPFGHFSASAELGSNLSELERRTLLDRIDQAGCCAVIIDHDGERSVGAEGHVKSARTAAERLRDRRDGRAFVFAGSHALRGRMTIRELLKRSAIESVQALGATAHREASIETYDFVRPYLQNGSLTLIVTPLADGGFQPFEVRQPHNCCADHPD